MRAAKLLGQPITAPYLMTLEKVAHPGQILRAGTIMRQGNITTGSATAAEPI
jgi:2-keto-4-pentenoate hydratase